VDRTVFQFSIDAWLLRTKLVKPSCFSFLKIAEPTQCIFWSFSAMLIPYEVRKSVDSVLWNVAGRKPITIKV